MLLLCIIVGILFYYFIKLIVSTFKFAFAVRKDVIITSYCIMTLGYFNTKLFGNITVDHCGSVIVYMKI